MLLQKKKKKDREMRGATEAVLSTCHCRPLENELLWNQVDIRLTVKSYPTTKEQGSLGSYNQSLSIIH